MNLWRVAQLSIVAAGVLVVTAGRLTERPNFDYVGVALLGLAAFFIGLEAMFRRQMIIGSRYRRYGTETYKGAAGIAQGIQFVFLGIFLMASGLLAYFNSGRSVFLYFIRRPGALLLAFGVFCYSSAVIAFSGSVEQKQGSKFVRILDLLASRLLPGIILGMIGTGVIVLGLLEISAPQVFDQLGGGFLEALFGGQ